MKRNSSDGQTPLPCDQTRVILDEESKNMSAGTDG